MKAFVFLLTVFGFVYLSSAHAQGKSCFSQMLEINSQWRYHQTDCPNESAQFDTDLDAIQAHLFLVVQSLSKNTPQALSKNQRDQRKKLLNALQEYAQAKVFPTNLYHAYRRPYFVDDFGVHCAVGYLMKESGFSDLVAQIRTFENYAYIENIQSPGVAEWAEEHGFTVDDLKWIQPGYLPAAHNVAPIGNGTNGPIRKMMANGSQGMVFSGVFDTLDLLPCMNIGVFKDNQLSCLGNGLHGLVSDIATNSGVIYAFGQFYHEDLTYSIAVFKEGQWEFENIPSREGAFASSGFVTGFISPIYEMAINHPENDSVQEIWRRYNDGNWMKQAVLQGFVNKIGQAYLDMNAINVYVGHFSQVTIFDYSGEILDTLSTNNVLFHTHSTGWYGLEISAVSDTINTFRGVGNQIFFGGTSSLDSNSTGVVLSRFLNNVVQPVLTMSSFGISDSIVVVNAIEYDPATARLCIGGKFNIPTTFSYYGNNLAYLNTNTNDLLTIGYFDKPVHALLRYNAVINFGGDFTTNVYTSPINHLAKVGPHLGLEENPEENPIHVFPNPSSDLIQVSGINTSSPFQILDLNGRVVIHGSVEESSTIDLTDLASGVYLISIKTNQGTFSTRLMKQ